MTLPGHFPVLLGLTSENRPITAFGCDTQRGSPPLLGRGSLRLLPSQIAHGVHFEGADDFALMSLSVRYSNLDVWADTSGFDIHPSTTPLNPVRIEYLIPQQVEAELPDGISVGVTFRVAGLPFRADSEVHIVQRAWVTVRATKSRSYWDLLRASTSFADMVALAVGQPLRPLEFSGTCSARVAGTDVSKAETIVIVDNRELIATENRKVHVREMLFSLKEIRSCFAEIVHKWFSVSAATRPLYDLYFGSLRHPFMYVEHRFLSMFQALESYDRRTRVASPEKEQAHQLRMERILSAVEAADKKWLTEKLRHSIEPSAEQRIRELVEQHGADWLLNKEAIKLAANMRNFHTHFSPEVEERLPPHEDRVRCMHNLAVRLQILCEAILLRLIGITDVRQRIERVERLERREVR